MPPHLPTRPGRRSGGTLLVLAGLSLLTGCGRPPAPAGSPSGGRPRGHVFVARLVTEHPLYEQYRRLEQEIAFLRQPCGGPALAPPVFVALGPLFLLPPEPPRFPLERFATDRQQWELTLLPETVATPAELAPDLAAELQWQTRMAERWARQQASNAQARAEASVAEARAAAVRARQEALNNAGLDLGAGDEAKAQAAWQAEHDRIFAEIESETATARAAANERLAQEVGRIQAQMRARIAGAEEDARQRMGLRSEILVNSGSENRTGMSKALVSPEAPPAVAGVNWQPTVNPAAAPPPDLAALSLADQRVRAEQAARLAATRADLARAIYQATALAVLRIAGVRHLEVYLPPEQPAAGRDLTEAFRPALRHVFYPASS